LHRQVGGAVLTAGLDVTHSLRNAAAVLAGHTSVAVEQTGSAIYGEKYGKEVIHICDLLVFFVLLGTERTQNTHLGNLRSLAVSPAVSSTLVNRSYTALIALIAVSRSTLW
jgi:hypothetical protein